MKTSVGSQAMTEQAQRIGWSPERGPFLIRTWIGPKDGAADLTAQLRAAKYEYDVQLGPVNATVTARIGTYEDGSDEEPVLRWERNVNKVEKSIFEHPKFSGLTEAEKRNVKAKFEKFQAGETSTVTLTGDALKIYNRLIRGIEAFVVEQPVVVLTETVSARFVINVARANIGRILSYSQMRAIEEAPDTVLDNKDLPTGLSGIARYGYRKGEPQITQQAGGKWQVVSEWEGGFWDVDLYEDAT